MVGMLANTVGFWFGSLGTLIILIRDKKGSITIVKSRHKSIIIKAKYIA